MRYRKLVATIAAVVALAVVTAMLHLSSQPSPRQITGPNGDRIRNGMSRAEVEAILGAPPGDYKTGAAQNEWDISSFRGSVSRGLSDGNSIEIWASDSVIVFVFFDRNQRVWNCSQESVVPADDGPLKVLWWRNRRLWTSLVGGV